MTSSAAVVTPAVYKTEAVELRCGPYQEVLADVGEVDAVITDPPYGERTHAGHDASASGHEGAGKDNSERRAISYEPWTTEDVAGFVGFWVPRRRGWFAAFSDSELCGAWQGSLERNGLTGFNPLPCIIPGMTVRLAGDGPSSWAVYLNVARPKSLARWGTLPGAYVGTRGERFHIGGKPLWLMRAIIRDYTKPGDLIVDPCAGGATTLLAAALEGRRAIGAEQDPNTFAKAVRRLQAGYTPSLFRGDV